MDWTSFWTEVGGFLGDWQAPLKIVAIVIGALLVRWLLLVILRRSIERVISGVKKSQNVEETQELSASPLRAARVVQRTRTLGTVINSVLTVFVMGVAVVAILEVLRVPVLGILGAAGVVAAGLAFGAQNVVKDILNGMFIVFEDQLGIGDIVDLGMASGTVENVGVRITSIRDVNGTLWHVRNGEILRVGNKSQGWARVIIDLPVPYHADLDAVKDAILRTAKNLAAAMAEEGPRAAGDLGRRIHHGRGSRGAARHQDQERRSMGYRAGAPAAAQAHTRQSRGQRPVPQSHDRR